MGNRNNSNARNKGCKEGWKYHSGRLDCPSNLNGIKTFLPNKFQITLTATCQHRGRFRTACVKSVTGSSHRGLPMHSFCRCSLNREMSSGAVSPQRLFFFFPAATLPTHSRWWCGACDKYAADSYRMGWRWLFCSPRPPNNHQIIVNLEWN